MQSATAAAVLAFVAGVGAGASGVAASVLPAAAIAALSGLALAAALRGVLLQTDRRGVRLQADRSHILLTSLACFAGVLHGGEARDAALHSAIRAELEASVGGASIDRIGVIGRHEARPLRAVLIEDAADAGDYVSLRVGAAALLVDGRWQPVGGGLVVTVNGAAERSRVSTWRAGRVIEAPVTFRRPTRYLNDGVGDFEQDAALAGITLFGSVKSPLLIEVIAQGTASHEYAADIRAVVRDAVTRWVRPHGDVAAAIVTAVLIGDRTGLPDEVRTRLQAAGTYHVIAISGGNIAILAALITAVFTVAGVHGRYGAVAAIITLLAYAQIVSAGPSVWRATLMAVLYFGARVFDHRAPAWHALAMTAGVLAVVQPLDVRDVGFLLTFGATIGLLAVVRIAARWSPRHQLIRWVSASLLASLAVELILLPISAGVFSRITAAGLLLNLIAIPAMAVVQVGGMVVVICDRFAAVATTAGWLAATAATMLVDSAGLVDLVPPLVHRVPPPAAWIITAYYAALLVVWRSSSHTRRFAQVALTLAGSLIVTGTDPLTAPSRSEGLRVTMIDVGQGESVLIEIPGAEPLLIDTGGSPFGGGFDIGGRVLAPALWARRVRRLGTLLVTHGDPDHIGGAPAVLADFDPPAVWWGTPVPPHQPSLKFLEEANRQRRVVAFRRAGQAFRLGDAGIRVLSPPPPDWERQKVRNDDSVVVEVLYHDVALVLTGDVGGDVERRIAPQLTAARVRVLKVGHHGSRTSSTVALLGAWRPQIALISAGRSNTFGHPAPEVLERLASIGARVYRTDLDGQITLDSDGRSVSVRTFTGGER